MYRARCYCFCTLFSLSLFSSIRTTSFLLTHKIRRIYSRCVSFAWLAHIHTVFQFQVLLFNNNLNRFLKKKKYHFCFMHTQSRAYTYTPALTHLNQKKSLKKENQNRRIICLSLSFALFLSPSVCVFVCLKFFINFFEKKRSKNEIK